MASTLQAVIVLLYKPENERFPQILGVYADVAEANRDALGYMGDFDPERPWTDNLAGEPVTEQRVREWVPVPGDLSSFEYERDGVIIAGEMHEVEHPVQDDEDEG